MIMEAIAENRNTSTATIKTRLLFIDMAKGVGMLWVVAVHTNLVKTPFFAFLDWSSAFALPLFFLISGIFHRDLPVREFAFKKVCQLLTPFICFNILGFAEELLRCAIGNGALRQLPSAILNFPWLVFDSPTWFLLALFETACLYNLLRKSDNRQICWLMIVVLAVFGFYINRFKLFGHHLFLPFFLGQALSMLPAYALGHLAAGCNGGLAVWTKKIWLAVLSISAAGIAALTLCHCFGGVQLAAATYKYGLVVTISGAVFGSAFVLAACRFVQWRGFAFLAYIGKNTLCIMAIHILILTPLYRFVRNGILQFLIALGGACLLCIPISRYCPFLCGKLKPEQLMTILSAFSRKKH